MTDTKPRIHEHVRANAGVHFNRLVRESGFAPGQVQYHLRRLIDEGKLVRDEFYGRTHYYPPNYEDWERGALALFRRETSREIVVCLIKNEPVSPGEVADELGVARSTLEHHLDHLVECDIVEKEYGYRNSVALWLANPEKTASLLETVMPTVPDRLVDRFTRFVDKLLEDSG